MRGLGSIENSPARDSNLRCSLYERELALDVARALIGALSLRDGLASRDAHSLLPMRHIVLKQAESLLVQVALKELAVIHMEELLAILADQAIGTHL